MEAIGYGFLLLFNGREYAYLKASGHATQVGAADSAAAVQAAQREGFPRRAVIFLDQEQGGRMLPEQLAYILAWVDGVIRGGYGAGIYCSGIPFHESTIVSVVTANDIRDHAGRACDPFLHQQRSVSAGPGLRLSQVSASAQSRRSAIRRRLAVRTIAAASGTDVCLPSDLRKGWQLLSAGRFAGVGHTHRCRYSELTRSIAREDTRRMSGDQRPTADEIEHAASLLRAGKLVAFPTETVYGLGANALDAEAVARIFEAKGRPTSSPIIVHVSNFEMVRSVVSRVAPGSACPCDEVLAWSADAGAEKRRLQSRPW